MSSETKKSSKRVRRDISWTKWSGAESKASKHTPGPWRVGADNGATIHVTGPRMMRGKKEVKYSGPPGNVVAFVSADPTNGAHHADARLIAAAPELLEALRALLNDQPQWVDQQGKTATERARALLARVDGGES